MITLESTHLFFQDRFSDKVYDVFLKQIDSTNYAVMFKYGRRGSTLMSGSKTPVSVPLEKAQTIYGKLVHDKKRKGYQEY
jgi:predicted DNA-binding WGR domain protein